ncbi:cwf21 domain-containing protein [Polychytrium aggregatum]|uniref:cwf21 domain-containing protein n=1 Tax=Polychytrium aggregatum TaxID=110093 RepID=UPI0022FE15EF|nr:cwf21 domain-containing protein [Polychytrium aggregatum]KAI9206913.1 cwf21 domain-containing protein [Polychytrium aggregatum]
MYNGIGLSTARGSGTNGYVQRNLSSLRPREKQDYRRDDPSRSNPAPFKKPNEDILTHDKKREIEIKCLELRDTLEESGVDESEIEDKVDELRKELLQKLGNFQKSLKEIQSHEVHHLAAAKEEKNRNLARAFGIREAEHVEGAAFDPEIQNAKKQERMLERARREEERQARFEEEQRRREKELRRRDADREAMRPSPPPQRFARRGGSPTAVVN